MRAELELRRRGLFVSVIGTRPVLHADEVITEVARNFQLREDLLKIHHTTPKDFLLMLPDKATALRVYDDSRPFHGPRFSLQFKKWSCFAHVEGLSLSSLVDIEIKGILTHAWERSTVEQLLWDSCWIQELHLDTEAKQDLSSFQLCVWCSTPERIHQRMGLVIPEQGLSAKGAPLTKQVSSTLSRLQRFR
jgi:hypothetical protein